MAPRRPRTVRLGMMNGFGWEQAQKARLAPTKKARAPLLAVPSWRSLAIGVAAGAAAYLVIRLLLLS